MNQLITNGIVLMRTNYGEADRIIRLLTPDSGKLSLITRGVRKPKSKLAGGIELFSSSSLTYVNGRGSLGTLVSARLETHYGNIVRNIDRVQLGYEVIKMLDRATEDEPEPEYYELLLTAFEALNDHAVSLSLIRLWFSAQLVAQAGHSPNLRTDVSGQRLSAEQTYDFDFDNVSFASHSNGRYHSDQIKFLRLIFAGNHPRILQQIQQSTELGNSVMPLVQTMLTTYIRV